MCSLVNFAQTIDTSEYKSKVKLSFDAGLILNSSYSNKPYLDKQNNQGGHSPTTISSQFYTSKSLTIKPGLTIGMRLALGSKQRCKALFGVSYLLTTAEFSRTESYNEYTLNYSNLIKHYKDYNYKNYTSYLNINSGVRIIVSPKMYFDNELVLSIPVAVSNIVNGYESTSYYTMSTPSIYTFNNEVLVYSINQKSSVSYVNPTLCYSPKLTYQSNVKQHQIGYWCSYNVAIKYSMSWLMFGVSYFPGRKK